MRTRALTRPVRAVATGAVLVGLVLSSAGCDLDRSAVATVGGTEIEADRVDEILDALVAADPDSYRDGVTGDGADTYSQGAASEILNILVLQVWQAEIAERLDLQPTEQNRTDAATAVDAEVLPNLPLPPNTDPAAAPEDPNPTATKILEELSEETVDWLVELRASTLALGEHAAEVVTVEDAPDAAAALCLRAIAVLPESADEVQTRLDDGEDFGAVASDPDIAAIADLAAQGGDLGQCLTPDALVQAQLDPAAVDLLVPLDVGEYVGPVDLGDDTSYWFQVADKQLDPETALQLLLADVGDGPDVSIDPRFGRWDATDRRVIAPEGARDLTVETDDTAPAGG